VAAALAVAAPTAGAPAAQAQPAPVYVVERGDTLFKIARANGLTVAQLKAYNGLESDVLSIGQRLLLRPAAAPDVPDTPVQTVELPPPPPSEVPLDEPAAPPVGDPPIDPETGLPADEYADEPADVGPSLITTMDGRELVLDPPEPIPTGPPPPPQPPAEISRVRIGAGTSGQVVIPAPSATAGPQTHVVQQGETLFAIARRYGTTVDALRRLNALRGDALAVGQRLTVAEGGAPPASQRSGGYDVTASTLPDDQVHTTRKGETLYSIAARYGTTVGRLLAVNTLTTAPLAPGTIVVLPDSVGVTYYREPAPMPEPDEVGLALVYPDSYEGRETISGEPYDPAALTASHRTLPFGTVLHVSMPATGRSTLVRVNDRGPVSEGFLIELSEAAAEAIGQNPGAAEKVEVRIVR
jgi:LysM repeat protein